MQGTIRLSDKPCFFCGSNDDTIELKIRDPQFQANVCWDHAREVLKGKGASQVPQPPEKTNAT